MTKLSRSLRQTNRVLIPLTSTRQIQQSLAPTHPEDVVRIEVSDQQAPNDLNANATPTQDVVILPVLENGYQTSVNAPTDMEKLIELLQQSNKNLQLQNGLVDYNFSGIAKGPSLVIALNLVTTILKEVIGMWTDPTADYAKYIDKGFMTVEYLLPLIAILVAVIFNHKLSTSIDNQAAAVKANDEVIEHAEENGIRLRR